MSSSRLKQIGSVVLTFLIYTWLLNWQAGLLLVVGIAFHEQSHLLAAQRMGMKTNKFYLVPFLGGVAFVSERYRSYAQQAFVVLAGPIGGGLLAIATAGLYWITGSQFPFLAAAAYWMAFLNLFNLFPLSFMDGGQVMGTITYSINETLGMVCLAVSTFLAIFILWHFNPFISVLVAFYGGTAVWKEIKDWKAKRDGKEWLCSNSYLYRPRKLDRLQMVLTISCWLGSAALLGALMLQLQRIPGANFSAIFHR
jgi:Zn-dependent protease